MFTHYAIFTGILNGLKNVLALRFISANGVTVYGLACVQAEGKPTGETETIVNTRTGKETVREIRSETPVLKHKLLVTYSEKEGYKIAATGKGVSADKVSVNSKNEIVEKDIRSSFGRLVDFVVPMDAKSNVQANWEPLPEPISLTDYEKAWMPTELGLSIPLRQPDEKSNTPSVRKAAISSFSID